MNVDPGVVLCSAAAAASSRRLTTGLQEQILNGVVGTEEYLRPSSSLASKMKDFGAAKFEKDKVAE
jgi:hypothetical protein